jgi:Glycosyltransferase family 87
VTADVPHAEEVRAMPVEGGERVGVRGIREAARQIGNPLALGVVLLLVFWWWLALAFLGSPGDWAFDFRQFWQGGKDVVEGVSPYPSAELLRTAGDHLDPDGIREVFRFPYPASAAVLLAPLGALEFEAAAALWSALLIACLLVAVWILGVRDWRVLAIVVSSAPVISSVRLGTFTPVLVLLAAVAWRWRDRKWISGGSLGLAISLKLFLWPLVVWLAATRRYAAAAIAAGLSAALMLGAWAAIGFDGLVDYPDLVRRLSEVVAPRSLSLVALGLEAGLPRGVADSLPWVVGLGLLAGVAVVARRADGDRIAFSLAVAAAIALTPIVWLHYFALLVVPVAIYRPRLAWVWPLFWLFWLTPHQTNQGDLWRILVVDGLVAALIVCSIVLYSRRTLKPARP